MVTNGGKRARRIGLSSRRSFHQSLRSYRPRPRKWAPWAATSGRDGMEGADEGGLGVALRFAKAAEQEEIPRHG